MLREHALADAATALRREANTIARAAASADGVESIQAFLAKRPPEFSHASA
jgi:chemotaxis response regulator CheB